MTRGRTTVIVAAIATVALATAAWAAPAKAGASQQGKPAASKPAKLAASQPTKSKASRAGHQPSPSPCVTTREAAADGGPRFVIGSPFSGKAALPPEKKEKTLWAKSFLFAKAPKLVVQKWLSAKPDLKGKYVLIEFWATWCPECRRSIHLLNHFYHKFGKKIVIIGISDQTEAAVRKLKKPKIDYYSAIDTQARMKKKLGVFGIPHVIILEPTEHVVIWEGFPYLKGFELTDKVIQKIVSIKPLKKKR